MHFFCRSRRQTSISLCQALCRSLVRPSDLDARSRAPHRSWGALALASDRSPTHPPFFFEAVAPRKLVSQLREITFSGPLASFVGKNFDTRQDACWGQLRDEAVCSPLVNSRRWRHQRINVPPT